MNFTDRPHPSLIVSLNEEVDIRAAIASALMLSLSISFQSLNCYDSSLAFSLVSIISSISYTPFHSASAKTQENHS